MSEAFLVAADLVFPAGKLQGWARLAAVARLLQSLEAEKPFSLVVDGEAFRWRAVLLDDALDACLDPLVEALGVAARRRARGELVVADDSTGGPAYVRRLVLGTDAALVKLAPKAARDLVRTHRGLADVRKEIDRLTANVSRSRATKPATAKRKPRPDAPTTPLATLDDAALMRAFAERVVVDPSAVREEVATHLAASSPSRERFLHATSHVFGQILVTYGCKPRGRGAERQFARDVVKRCPAWGELLATMLRDPEVHAHFREGAFSALASTADRRWLPTLLENLDPVDAMTVSAAARAFGPKAAKEMIARLTKLDPERAEAVEVWLEETGARV